MSDSTPTLPVIKLRDLFEANAKRKAKERTFDYLGRHNVHLLFNTREEENKMPREKGSIKPEEAQSIVAYLLRTGVLDEETVKLAIREEPTEERKSMCNLLHSIMCKEEHPNICTYLDDDNWSGVAHRRWLANVDEALMCARVTQVIDLMPILQRALGLSNNLQAAGLHDPAAYRMLLYIRGWEE